MKDLLGKFRLAFWLLILAEVGLAGCQQIINYPAPKIVSISPTSVPAGQPNFRLTITGFNFTPASSINWNGIPLSAIFVSTNELTAQIPATLVQTASTVQVTVSTPNPGGGVTLPLTFTINPTASPVPSITATSPSSVFAGSGDVTLNVIGTNFVALSAVSVNSIPLQTTFLNSKSLQATIPGANLAHAGSLQIAVLNPPPGGGNSNLYSVSVNNPVPSLTSLTPANTPAGGASASLSITGAGFVPESVITINGAPHPTTGGGTQVSALLSAADLAAGGIAQVQVVNPLPGGGASNMLTFAITPTVAQGLPVLVDYGFDGSQANNGICSGGVTAPTGFTNCQNGTFGLDLTTSGPSISQTGEFVAFASVSTNLVASQASASNQIFVRDTCLGTSCTPATFVVSVAAGGGAANGPSSEPSINTAGDHVAYTSLATDLVDYVQVAPRTRQVYWQPVCAPSTTTSKVALCTSSTTSTTKSSQAVLVSLGVDGSSPGNGGSYDPVISPDGQYVAFVSLATNLASGVPPGLLDGVTPQVYIRTICDGATPLTLTASATCTPTTYLVSSPDGVTPGNGPSSNPDIANAGTFVTFASSASNLGVASGTQEIFEQNQCELTSTSCTRTTTLISTPDGTTAANGTSSDPAISYDGRFVAFASMGTNLVAGPAPPAQQVYVRDTCAGAASCTQATHLVSTLDGTTPGNGLSEHPTINRNATGSGQFIAFASVASNLSSNATNGIENIYVRDTCDTFVSTSTACAKSTAVVSEAAGSSPPAANDRSFAPSISADGHTVGFLSFASNIVARDLNNLEDIFLAATSF